jgi:hypothetical protein
MKKYEVTLYYHAVYSMVVEAENEEDAIEQAYNQDFDSEDVKCEYQEDGEPDVQELK